jgi:hypothetical protein
MLGRKDFAPSVNYYCNGHANATCSMFNLLSDCSLGVLILFNQTSPQQEVYVRRAKTEHDSACVPLAANRTVPRAYFVHNKFRNPLQGILYISPALVLSLFNQTRLTVELYTAKCEMRMLVNLFVQSGEQMPRYKECQRVVVLERSRQTRNRAKADSTYIQTNTFTSAARMLQANHNVYPIDTSVLHRHSVKSPNTESSNDKMARATDNSLDASPVWVYMILLFAVCSIICVVAVFTTRGDQTHTDEIPLTRAGYNALPRFAQD